MPDDNAALLRRAAAVLEYNLEYLRACDPEAADEIRETTEDVRDLRALADAMPRYDAALRLARAGARHAELSERRTVVDEMAVAACRWSDALAAYRALGEEA